MAKKIQLTNEEKIIKKYYNSLVERSRFFNVSKEELIKFSQKYVNEVLKGTRYENEVIIIEEEKNPDNAGSMNTQENGTPSVLKINFEELVQKDWLNSKNENERFVAFVELLDTLNHETQHYFQNKDVENFKFTKNSMTFSNCLEIIREKISTMTDREKFYSVKEGNYPDVYIEGDARRTGCIKTATQLLRIAPKMPSKWKSFLETRVFKSMKKDNVEFNKFKFDGSFEKYDRNDVTSAYVDEYIAAHPNALKKKQFSALNFEYREDGTRYAFEEVLEMRNEAYLSIKNNKKINEETRSSMLKQINAGFAQIMYNSLARSSKEKIIDIRRRIGDEQFIKEIDYIHTGKLNEIKEKVKKYEQYSEFFNENKKMMKKERFIKASEEIDQLYINTGYQIRVDDKGKKYATINSTQIDMLKKLGTQILDTKNQYPMYTEEELEESNRKREIRKLEVKEDNKDRFAQRRFEQKKKREREERLKQEQAEIRRQKARREHERKMKNPFYRIKYNMGQVIKNIGKKKLPAPSKQGLSKELLFEKREEVEALNKEKYELEQDLSNVKLEVEDTLLKAENQMYIDKQEQHEKDNIKKEEENIGKGNI